MSKPPLTHFILLVCAVIFPIWHNILLGQFAVDSFLTSDQFNPNALEKNIRNFDINQSERKLLNAYHYQLKGQLENFTKTMETINDVASSFNKTPFFDYLYHLQKCFYFETKGQLDLAKIEAQFSQKIANQSHEKIWEAWAFANLGRLYGKENQKDTSVLFHKKSIEFAKRTEGKLTMALVLHEFALTNNRFFQIEKAVEQELLALELVQKIKNDYYTSKFYQFIATLSLNAGNLREAENYLLKSNQKNNRNPNQLVQLENELINYRLLLKKGLPREVDRYIPKTIKAIERQQAEASIGEAWLIFGQALSINKKHEEALIAFSKAIAFFERQSVPKNTAEAYYQIGLDFSRRNNLKEAEKQFRQSINIFSNLNDNRGLNENYFALSEVFQRMGKMQQAWFYLKKYSAFLTETSFSIDSKAIEELTQSNTREERERLINTQEEELSKELKEKEILQLQSDRQLLGIIIVVVVFFVSGLTLFFVNRQRNTLQEQRETEMSQTLLRSQMNPHFIFNALAVIQSYIYENTPEKTSSFLVNFSRLIRLILENSPKEFITIDIEKEILSKYLITQKLRFEDRFNFELMIDENLISKRALIPPMITQPFVENSIEHGQLHSIENGIIKIKIYEHNGMLEIEVTDNGVGRKQAAKIKRNTNHKSMALDITRERILILNKKYKGKGSLEITDLDVSAKKGTRVIICLPLLYENIIFERNEKNTNH